MKRKRKTNTVVHEPKRRKLATHSRAKPTWALLRQYYANVSTLRHYLASQLCRISKKRQRSILKYGFSSSGDVDPECDPAVLALLDEAVVCTFDADHVKKLTPTDLDLSIFTQQLSLSNSSISPTQGVFEQTEIIDFTLWLLFQRHSGQQRPAHLLTHGYQRHSFGQSSNAEAVVVPGIPGVYCNGQNRHASKLKQKPWTILPTLVGNDNQRVLIDLFMTCGIFSPVDTSSNLEQICGLPLSELKIKPRVLPQMVASLASKPHDQPNAKKPRSLDQRGLSSIRFLRHRMFYARPTLNGKGNVHFGLNHAHVLNRCKDVQNERGTIHVMRYIFPRQFGHHNVFTSDVDPRDAAQPFKDYTLRDDEIARATIYWQRRRTNKQDDDTPSSQPVPKRLRGRVVQLVSRLRKHHAQCSYTALLNHYCPLSALAGDDTNGSTAHASPPAQVSAFCRAAVNRVFPDQFWGVGETKIRNEKIIFDNIDMFSRLRRYETFSLHDCLQRIQLVDVKWLRSRTDSATAKSCQTDFTKRRELMAELLYYVFDSYLIPLIRGHFHVTESGANRNRLFYFRHDVWKAISEPALASLKTKMLEPCPTALIKKTLTGRSLGVSQVRLLPKEHGMRPIINLRRRVQQLQRGQMVLGRSINSILTPAFSVLNCEKVARGDLLGSALFSVDDMYPRLQAFRQRLQDADCIGQPLYFAKVDVKACFDTIPQKKLMQLVRQIVGVDAYQIIKYSRAKLIGGTDGASAGFGAKPSIRFLTKATPECQQFDFSSEIKAETADGKTRTVFVDGGVQRIERRKTIVELLDEHVLTNLIQIGNKFYRQREGIPQGSIVSSLLCSFFYAEMEQRHLRFLNDGPSLLLRLIDDFLVISTRQDIAERFMRVMHAGIPEYGVEVKLDKSRTNFEMEMNGESVPRLPASSVFPYCGKAIDTVTLDISRDRERRLKSHLADSVSVEYSKLPGQTFYRKALTALKLQMQAMLLSTSYNSIATVHANLQHAFDEVALKIYHYIRSLPWPKQPPAKLVIRDLGEQQQKAAHIRKRKELTPAPLFTTNSLVIDRFHRLMEVTDDVFRW